MSATVIKLPTAAPNRVRNCWSRAKAADRKSVLRFPWTRAMKPEQRREHEKALESARILAQITEHPAMSFASAIWRALDDMQRIKVQMFLAMGRSEPSLQALEWTHFLEMNNGDRARVQYLVNQILGESE